MTFAYGKNMLPATVGFDRLISTIDELDRMFTNTKPQTYPPYNIIKTDDFNYEIQVAVAGFRKENITIEQNLNKLTVIGVSKKNDENITYFHQGLAMRDFKHTYTLSDFSVVRGADIVDGILSIFIENVIPEEKKTKSIPIGFVDKRLLTE